MHHRQLTEGLCGKDRIGVDCFCYRCLVVVVAVLKDRRVPTCCDYPRKRMNYADTEVVVAACVLHWNRHSLDPSRIACMRDLDSVRDAVVCVDR